MTIRFVKFYVGLSIFGISVANLGQADGWAQTLVVVLLSGSAWLITTAVLPGEQAKEREPTQ